LLVGAYFNAKNLASLSLKGTATEKRRVKVPGEEKQKNHLTGGHLSLTIIRKLLELVTKIMAR
jgi:hypothetical protein